MRRTALLLAAVSALTILGPVGPASAGTPPVPDVAGTVWVQPGTGLLDGVGAFLFVAQPPAPGPAQGSPAGYEYSLTFHLEDGSFGTVVLGHQNGQKVAGFGILPTTLVATVPYDWKYGRAYYLLTYRLSATQWGAWVLDWSTGAWTVIATHTVPETAGRMLPEATTMVDYDPPPPPPNADTTCAYYPRTDALFYPPQGWRGAAVTTATVKANAGYDGECTSTATPYLGWQWFTLGQAAS